MNGRYQPGQKVFLSGGNKSLIKEAAVLKHTGGIKDRGSRICPPREETVTATLNRKKTDKPEFVEVIILILSLCPVHLIL